MSALSHRLPGALSSFTPPDGSVVTVGAFDGIHLGHQALLGRAVTRARSLSVPAIAYTFHPHPAKILAPDMAPRTLMSVDERVERMCALGIDSVIVEPFDRAFAEVEAEDWVRRYLVDRLRPRAVVVGFNFTYGRARAGNVDALVQAGEALGFSVEVVPPVQVDGILASSTRVREFLLEGNLEGARLLLGRPVTLTGVVVKGDQRGRLLGFPTANLDPEHELLPERGVYATRVRVLDDTGGESAQHDAVTNIGLRPTFDGRHVTVESFLLDWSGDLYGARLRVELVARLRGEQRFENVDALKQQLDRDVATAREVLAA